MKLLTATAFPLVATVVTAFITLFVECSLVGPRITIKHACPLLLLSSRGSKPTRLLHLLSTELMAPSVVPLALSMAVIPVMSGAGIPPSPASRRETLPRVRPMTLGTLTRVSMLIELPPREKFRNCPDRPSRLANGLPISALMEVSTLWVVATLSLNCERLWKKLYRGLPSLVPRLPAVPISLRETLDRSPLSL